MTFDEYEQAVFRTIECAEANGIVISDVVLAHGAYLYGFHDAFDTEAVNHSAPLHDQCYRRSLEPLEMPYFVRTGLIGRKPTAADSDLASCLHQSGLEGPFDASRGLQPILDRIEEASIDVSDAVRDRVSECLDEHVSQ